MTAVDVFLAVVVVPTAPVVDVVDAAVVAVSPAAVVDVDVSLVTGDSCPVDAFLVPPPPHAALSSITVAAAAAIFKVRALPRARTFVPASVDLLPMCAPPRDPAVVDGCGSVPGFSQNARRVH